MKRLRIYLGSARCIHTMVATLRSISLIILAAMLGGFVTLSVVHAQRPYRADSSQEVGALRDLVAEHQRQWEKAMDSTADHIRTLEQEVSTIRGMGVGASAVFTLLQVIQVVLFNRKKGE